MSNLKKISQETFDAVVKENLDEFGMTTNEAINDAVEQFKAQNVDLFNIVKEVYVVGENERLQLPSERIKGVVEVLNSTDNEVTDPVESVITECNKSLAHRCLAGTYGAGNYLIKRLRRDSEEQKKQLESLLAALISLTNGQPDILKEDSLTVLLQLGNDLCTDLCPRGTMLLGSILKILHNCCVKHEENRQTLVNAGVIELAMRVLDRKTTAQKLIAVTCLLLRSLTLDDDVRVPFGRAHDHAKLIATNHSGINVLLELANVERQSVNVLNEIIATLSCLTVRNEFCQEVNDKGGLQLIFNCVIDHIDNMPLVKNSLSLLKTLAGNDTVKVEIIKAGGLNFVLLAMNKYQAEPRICEAGCSCLAAFALCSPSNCKAIVEAGGSVGILNSMKMHKNEPSVQKQACRAVRDLVSRCRQFCPIFLDNGVEELIRDAANRYPNVVADDAKAALRDLGCKVELKELWTGEKGAIVNQ